MKKREIALIIMDGVGISDNSYGNALMNANTPNLDRLLKEYPHTFIKAHGTAVGMPSDNDMGNSEVGHNAMGCGQIYSQGAKLVDEAIKNGDIFKSKTWKELVDNCKDNNTMHFIGLLSDGNVHSNINHLLALLDETKKEGIKKVRVHIFLDGRDVDKLSALKYVEILENKLNELNDDTFDGMIASGGGRMKITMDRYEANWNMVEEGWKTHVLGIGRKFSTAEEAIKTIREETNEIDQDLDPFVIAKNNTPVGEILDGDSVVLFNFRGDRAIELSRCFDEVDFDKFDRVRYPKVLFAGMLEYDSDLKIPKKYLTEPPKISNTLTEELNKYGIKEYAISETQKFGHVTYFWNGNRTEKFDDNLETWEEVDSDVISFDKKPVMKSFEITDKFIDAILSTKYDFLRLNYPNGDMVGHTGNYLQTIKGLEAVDTNIGRVMEAIDKVGGVLIVLADHGNAEEMYQLNNDKKEAKTSHTLNKVPFIIYGKDISDIKIKNGDFGLANLASTITSILNIKPNSKWLESIVEIKRGS